MAAGTTYIDSVVDAASTLLKRLVSSSIPQYDSNDTKIAVTRLLELLRGPNASQARHVCEKPDDRTRHVNNNNNNASPQAVLDRLNELEDKYLRPIAESTRKAGVLYTDIARQIPAKIYRPTLPEITRGGSDLRKTIKIVVLDQYKKTQTARLS